MAVVGSSVVYQEAVPPACRQFFRRHQRCVTILLLILLDHTLILLLSSFGGCLDGVIILFIHYIHVYIGGLLQLTVGCLLPFPRRLSWGPSAIVGGTELSGSSPASARLLLPIRRR